MSEALEVAPVGKLHGRFTVPGDKSITHRAYLLGGLAAGVSTVRNPNRGLDCERSLRAMVRLGARVVRVGDDVVQLHGAGGALGEPDDVIDCGNSGTSMRLLCGVAAGQPETTLVVLTGDASLRGRPMQRVIEPLARMGARIQSRAEGRAPLVVRGARLRGIRYRLPVASAQVKSAVLLAGLAAAGRTSVVEPVPTRDHTERMLRRFGVEVTIEAGARGARTISLEGGADLTGTEIVVPGDPSAAAFLLVAGLIVGDAEVCVENVGLNPGRRAVIDALIEMGAEIEVRGAVEGDGGIEPVATVVARSSALRGIEIAGERVPGLIDELPVLAVAAAYATGTTVVAGAGELRVKESDRISLICRNLAACGVPVEERSDGFRIRGGVRPHGAVTDAAGDHRIAMAMAVLGLAAHGGTCVRGAGNIPTSFPGFAEQLAAIGALR